MLDRSGWSGPTFGPGVEPELWSGSRFEKRRVKTGRNRTMASLEPSRLASHMKSQWVQENWSGPGKTHFQRHSSSLSQSDPRVHFSATTKPPCAPLQPSRRHTTSSQLWTRERYVEYVYGGRTYFAGKLRGSYPLQPDASQIDLTLAPPRLWSPRGSQHLPVQKRIRSVFTRGPRADLTSES